MLYLIIYACENIIDTRSICVFFFRYILKNLEELLKCIEDNCFISENTEKESIFHRERLLYLQILDYTAGGTVGCMINTAVNQVAGDKSQTLLKI